MKDDSYWNDCRTKYTREAPKKYNGNYVTDDDDDDEYCDCDFLAFEESPRKPEAKRRQSARREASKFSGSDKTRENYTRYDELILETGIIRKTIYVKNPKKIFISFK